MNVNIADKPVSIIAIIERSHHSISQRSVSICQCKRIGSLYLVLSLHRPRNDEDWQAAILARHKRFPSDVTTNGPIEGNRSDFAIRDPNRSYGQREPRFIGVDGAAAIRAIRGLQDTPHNFPSSDRISACP